MAQKSTVTSGPLGDPSTWAGGELPQAGDDVLILHNCTVVDADNFSYASLTIGDNQNGCTLQCSGVNSVSAPTMIINSWCVIAVAGATTLSGAVRIAGSHNDAALTVASYTGSLTINGDVTHDAAAGAIGISVDRELTVNGFLRGTCDGGFLVSLQGVYNASLTLNGGIEANVVNLGAAVYMSANATVNALGALSLRGDRLFAGTGRIQIDNSGIGAPGDPIEWYPQPDYVLQGIQYRNGGLTGTYVPQGYPLVHQVLSGVQFGATGEHTGTRADCPAAKALTTASYGDPSNPTLGEVNLELYTLKTAVAAAPSVLRDVPRWTGGPLGTYWPTIASQVQLGTAFGPDGSLLGALSTLDWTDAEKQQIRQALGVDGTKTATAAGVLDAVKSKTDALPAQPAAVGDAMTLTSAERIAVADALLTRDVAHVENTAAEHSLCYVVLAMSAADVVTHPGKLTVFRTDGSTEFAQRDVTAQAGAAPITGVR